MTVEKCDARPLFPFLLSLKNYGMVFDFEFGTRFGVDFGN